MYQGDWRQTTPPTVEPVTLQEACDWCKVSLGDDAAVMTGLVKAARHHVEMIIGRQLITATWTLKLDGFPCRIVCPRPPLASVTSITYTDEANATQTLSASLYQVDTYREPGIIVPEYGRTWPTTRADTVNTVTVVYQAGYGATGASVPDDIKTAILLLCAHWYEHREEVITGTIQTTMDKASDALLAPYMVWT